MLEHLRYHTGILRASSGVFGKLKREWTNCFIKSNQEILIDLADFALREQPEENLVVAIFRAWYNGSYTMAAN